MTTAGPVTFTFGLLTLSNRLSGITQLDSGYAPKALQTKLCVSIGNSINHLSEKASTSAVYVYSVVRGPYGVERRRRPACVDPPPPPPFRVADVDGVRPVRARDDMPVRAPPAVPVQQQQPAGVPEVVLKNH